MPSKSPEKALAMPLMKTRILGLVILNKMLTGRDSPGAFLTIDTQPYARSKPFGKDFLILKNDFSNLKIKILFSKISNKFWIPDIVAGIFLKK
jgi:hypothetical protein